MNNLLHIITAVIATVATVFMAIFAWALLKINRRQHQLDFEQELILHSCEPTLAIVQVSRCAAVNKPRLKCSPPKYTE